MFAGGFAARKHPIFPHFSRRYNPSEYREKKCLKRQPNCFYKGMG